MIKYLLNYFLNFIYIWSVFKYYGVDQVRNENKYEPKDKRN